MTTDIQVNLSGGGFNLAQYEQLKQWGFGGILGGEWQLNGMDAATAAGSLYGFSERGGASNVFAGPTGNPINIETDSRYALLRSVKADVANCHAAGLRRYVGLPWYNTFWSGADPDPTFASQFLGGWEGADWDGTGTYEGYLDAGGANWQHWYRAIADYGDALNWIGADGLAYDNEDTRTKSQMSTWWWQSASNNWGNPTSPATPTYLKNSKSGQPQWQGISSQAECQRLAYIAGQRMMYYLNNGRCDDFVGNLHPPNGNNYPLYGYMTAGCGGNIPGGYTSQEAFSGSTTFKVWWPKGPGAVDGYVTQPNAVHAATCTWMWWVAGMASKTTNKFVLGNSAYYFPGALTAAHWAYDVEAFANINATMNASPGSPGGFAMPSNVKIAPYIWLLVSTAVHEQFGGDDWGQAVWNNTKPALAAAAEVSGSYNIYLAQTPIGSADFGNDAYSSPKGANYTPVDVL